MTVYIRGYGCIHQEIWMCSSANMAVFSVYMAVYMKIYGCVLQEICMCSTGEMAVYLIEK
jgi:hypothetical protein